jgi:S1-C subfamily serine protease
MKKIIVSVLLALSFVLPTFAADWSSEITKLEKSIVYVESADGGCTGAVIDQAKHYVLTAAHCYSEKLFVDLTPATVVAVDTHQDLMVLVAPLIDPSRPALKLALKNADRGSEVMSAGYGYAIESAQFRIAHIADNNFRVESIAQTFFALDATFVPGQSGGPVVNSDLEIVMIVQRGSDSVGIGIPAETIRARVGRFFAASK